ncbi:MAG: hemerythrin domain-containing protein [Cyanobacteria bacterium]|nr:hemerythrin domain-containing protein [Cyanobacteriota bacterium]
MDRTDEGRRPLDVMCTDIVDRYHAALHRSLPQIRAWLTAFAREAASPAAREMCEVFAELAEQIHSHLAKEEHLVFPALSALPGADTPPFLRPPTTFATVLHPIRVLEAEHVRIEQTLGRLHELALAITAPDSLSVPFRRCMTELAEFDRHLREHHRIENEVLFPRALELERQVL